MFGSFETGDPPGGWGVRRTNFSHSNLFRISYFGASPGLEDFLLLVIKELTCAPDTIPYTNQSQISMDFGNFEARSNTHSIVDTEQFVFNMERGEKISNGTNLLFFLHAPCSMRFVSVLTLMV